MREIRFCIFMFPINVTVGAVRLGLTGLQKSPTQGNRTGLICCLVFVSLCTTAGTPACSGIQHTPNETGELLCCVYSHSPYNSPQLCTNTRKVTEKFPEKEHCWYAQVWLLSLALGTPPGFQWCTDGTSAVATYCHYYLSGTAKPTAWRETLEFHAAPITRRDTEAFPLYVPITTSQNHRTVEGGKALYSKQAHVEQAAQGHIQSCF